MGVDGVAPTIGSSDLGDGAIDRTHTAATGSDPNDGLVRDRFGRLSLADFGKMGALINAIDNQVMAMAQFVGEPAQDHAADDRCSALAVGSNMT